jgi:L-histidine N-alpha-methyltransferase
VTANTAIVGVERDEESDVSTFLADVLYGLSKTPKILPCKYFYDDHGSQLFEDICGLDEYYVTRTELVIMNRCAGEMAKIIGPNVGVLEFGSGTGIKTRLLLNALNSPHSYTPIDISEEILLQSVDNLRESFPGLRITPVLADYTAELPDLDAFNDSRASSRLVYFPGSTLGNFNAGEAGDFLARLGVLLGPDGLLLIGLDLIKDEEILTLAYDDPGGVTAEFNKNILHRINTELGANFNPGLFRHQAIYNREFERIEMHLVSEAIQEVSIGEDVFHFGRNETIHTESSHKYSVSGFGKMAGTNGFSLLDHWTDEREYFAIFLLKANKSG